MGRSGDGKRNILWGWPNVRENSGMFIHASGVLDFLLDRTALWVGGLRKVGIELQLRLLDYIEWLGSRCEELPIEPNYKCWNKEKPNQRYFKGKLSFISSWQRHSNDFRQQSVVEIGYEHEFCLFDTRTDGLMSYFF